MKEFKIRASGSGKIMGVKGLGKTGQAFIEEWLKQQIYNTRKDISSKYLDKGNMCEEDSIDFIAHHKDYFGIHKNEQYFEDEYFCGTPDVITKDYLIDVKNSWDCFTFPLFETDVPNKDYFYQAQVYMHLTGVHKYKLIYTLLDTPEELLYKSEPTNYKAIDAKYRIKEFEIDYDPTVIEKMKERVLECREYVNQLNKTIC